MQADPSLMWMFRKTIADNLIYYKVVCLLPKQLHRGSEQDTGI